MLEEIQNLQVPNNIEELIDVTKITVDTLKKYCDYPGIIDKALSFIIPFSEKFDIRYNSIFYIEQIILKNHFKDTIACHPSWHWWVKRYRHYVLDDEKQQYLEYKETIKNTFETLKKVCTKEYNYDII